MASRWSILFGSLRLGHRPKLTCPLLLFLYVQHPLDRLGTPTFVNLCYAKHSTLHLGIIP
jgi:hypothetical protein